VALPTKETKGSDPTAELTRLESQDLKASAQKNSSGVVKGAAVRSSAASYKGGSGTNATYQKPSVPKRP